MHVMNDFYEYRAVSYLSIGSNIRLIAPSPRESTSWFSNKHVSNRSKSTTIVSHANYTLPVADSFRLMFTAENNRRRVHDHR